MYLCQGLFLISSTRQLFPSLCAASGSALGPLPFPGSVRDFSHVCLMLSVCWQLPVIPPAWTALLYSTRVSLPYSTSPLGRGSSNAAPEADLLFPVKAAPPISANGSTVLSGAQVKNLCVFLDSSFSLTLHIQPLNPLGTVFKIYPESRNFSPPPVTTLAKTPSPLTCNLSPLTQVTFLFVQLAILSISALTSALLLIMGSLLSSQFHGELSRCAGQAEDSSLKARKPFAEALRQDSPHLPVPKPVIGKRSGITAPSETPRGVRLSPLTGRPLSSTEAR